MPFHPSHPHGLLAHGDPQTRTRVLGTGHPEATTSDATSLSLVPSRSSRGRGKRLLSVLAAALALAGFLATGATPAYANGTAVTEVFKGQQGAYQLTVRAIAPRLLLGNAHFSIILRDATSRRLIPDAQVSVRAVGPAGAAAGPAQGYHEVTTSQYYDVNIPVVALGQWQFTVSVSGAGGSQEFLFPWWWRRRR